MTPAGRLMTVDVSTPVSTNEVDRLGDEIKAALARIGGEVLICVNLAHAGLLPPHVIADYVGIMRRDNPYLLRSAYWVAAEGLLSQQIARMLSEAANPMRRQFRHRGELEAWLGELMSGEEKLALRTHLDQFGS